MRVVSFLVTSALLSGAAAASIVVAPTAVAECTNAGGATVCAQGSVRGPDTGEGAGWSGPVVPYPCGYDWYCDDDWGWDLDIDLDPGPGRPGGPGGPGGIGPGRPGGGGGIIGGGGGGGGIGGRR